MMAGATAVGDCDEYFATPPVTATMEYHPIAQADLSWMGGGRVDSNSVFAHGGLSGHFSGVEERYPAGG